LNETNQMNQINQINKTNQIGQTELLLLHDIQSLQPAPVSLALTLPLCAL